MLVIFILLFMTAYTDVDTMKFTSSIFFLFPHLWYLNICKTEFFQSLTKLCRIQSSGWNCGLCSVCLPTYCLGCLHLLFCAFHRYHHSWGCNFTNRLLLSVYFWYHHGFHLPNYLFLEVFPTTPSLIEFPFYVRSNMLVAFLKGISNSNPWR